MRMIPSYIREDFRRHRAAWWVIIIATMVLLVFTFKRTRLTTNPRSRIITVERLLEAGTFVHDGPEGTTPFELSIDHVRIDDRIYSSKPPNYPLLMAAEAWPIRQLTGWNFYAHRVDYVRILTILNQVLPFGLMLITALFLLQQFTRDRWTLTYMMIAMSFGSLAYLYAVTINNHTVAGIFFFVAFALAIRYRTEGGSWFQPFAGGLLAGFAASVELPGLVFLLLIGGIYLFSDRKSILPFVVGALIPIAVSGWAFYSMSGSPKPFYLQGHLYRYEGSYWTSPEGLDVLRDPWYVYLFHLLFGHHGMFSITPALILGSVGLASIIRKNTHRLRWVAAGMGFGIFIVLLFILRRTHNYGGYCIGPRWFIHFMPMLMFLGFPVVEKLGGTKWGRVVCIVLVLAGLPWLWEGLWHEAYIRSSWEILWLGNDFP